MKEISIIITHYKNPRLLLNLLNVLTQPPQDFEIIVADSAALKGTRLLFTTEFKDITYIPFVKNVGYAKLVNAGLAKAKGMYRLIINADILIEPQKIKKMAEFLAKHPRAGAVGVSAGFHFPTFSALVARRSIWAKTPWGKKALEKYEMTNEPLRGPRAVDWVRGDCWMLTKQATQKVGLIDERFFMYLEDTDWCRRAHKEEFAIYFLPAIRVAQQQKGASRKPGVAGLCYRFWHVISFIKYIVKWNNQ